MFSPTIAKLLRRESLTVVQRRRLMREVNIYVGHVTEMLGAISEAAQVEIDVIDDRADRAGKNPTPAQDRRLDYLDELRGLLDDACDQFEEVDLPTIG